MARYEITPTADELIPPGMYHCVAKVAGERGTTTVQGPIKVTEPRHPQAVGGDIMRWVHQQPGLSGVGLVGAVLTN
ncbi:hypothetical protein [Streptomyces sp. NPDC001966]